MVNDSGSSNSGFRNWITGNKGFAATAAAAIVLLLLLVAVVLWAIESIKTERQVAQAEMERANRLKKFANSVQFAFDYRADQDAKRASREQDPSTDEPAKQVGRPVGQVSEKTPQAAEVHEALMQGMRDAQTDSAPGQEHEFLEGLVGMWDQTYRLWPDPSLLALGAPPLEGHGDGVNSMILGTMEPPIIPEVHGEERPEQVMRDGRFLSMTSQGWYGFDKGMSDLAAVDSWVPFAVLRILGFDQQSREHTASGFGLESTRGTSETGKLVSENKLVFHGTLEGREATFVYRREFEKNSDVEYTVALIVTEVNGEKLDDFKRFEVINRRKED